MNITVNARKIHFGTAYILWSDELCISKFLPAIIIKLICCLKLQELARDLYVLMSFQFSQKNKVTPFYVILLKTSEITSWYKYSTHIFAFAVKVSNSRQMEVSSFILSHTLIRIYTQRISFQTSFYNMPDSAYCNDVTDKLCRYQQVQHRKPWESYFLTQGLVWVWILSRRPATIVLFILLIM
jgi:hypothetical protein